jgi:hypothetical protein
MALIKPMPNEAPRQGNSATASSEWETRRRREDERYIKFFRTLVLVPRLLRREE